MSIASKLNDVFGNSENKEVSASATVVASAEEGGKTTVSKKSTKSASVPVPAPVSETTTNTFVRKGRENEDLLPWENKLRVSGIIVNMYKNKDNINFVTLMTKSGKNRNGEDIVHFPQFRFFSETKGLEAFRVRDFITVVGYARSFYLKNESGFAQAYIGTSIALTEPTDGTNGRTVRRFENTAVFAGEVVSMFRTEKVESYTLKTIRDGKASFFTVINFRHDDRVVLHSFVKIEAKLQTQRKTVKDKTVTTDSIVASSIFILETQEK